MTQKIRNSHGMVPLPLNQLINTGRGYSVVRGCGVVLAENPNAIELTVNSGRVIHNGEELSIPEQNITLQDGSIQGDRWDLIWIDRFGNVRSKTGKAGDTIPAEKEGVLTWEPPPPDATVIDGVPVASVWVPGRTESSNELSNTRNVIDRRVVSPPFGTIPELDADPEERDLRNARIWFNESANAGDGAFRAYNPAENAIEELNTTTIQTFGAPMELVIEDFETTIDANWRGGDSTWNIEPPAFEGDNAAWHRQSGRTMKYSLPGDGLEEYPDAGDTISLAVRSEGTDGCEFGFAKESDNFDRDYRVRMDEHSNEIELYRFDSSQTEVTLSTESVSLSTETWYIIEADYDGGGEGVHPFRIWSTTAGGERDAILAEDASPPADTTYQGRGVAVGIKQNDGGIDRLAVK